MNIKHRKITSCYLQANVMIEKFMKCNYRSSIHATTDCSPARLFFNRSLNDKQPTMTKTKSQNDEKVKIRQDSTYKKVTGKFKQLITASKLETKKF